MAIGEVERLRRLLEQTVRASGRSQRDVERALGVSRGYLTQLFNGRLELRVKHVVLITDELGLGPAEFFRAAYPPAPGEPGQPAPAAVPPAADPADPDLERFDAHIRKLLGELLVVWLQRLTLADDVAPSSRRNAADAITEAPGNSV